MIGQNIHNVVSFKVADIKQSTTGIDSRTAKESFFYTRKIIVTDNKGNELELTMFSDDKETLIPVEAIGYR